MERSLESDYSRRNQVFAFLASATVTTFGSVALAGRLLHNDALKSIIPGGTAVKPNMAAGFLLCGVALALLSGKQLSKPVRIFAELLAATVVVFASLTFAEYFFGCNLSIDRWLIDAPSALQGSHTGRVAPATTWCFVLAGVALFVAALPIAKLWLVPLVGGLSAALVVIGAIALVGFILEMLLGPAWNYMGMSLTGVPGAVSFLLLGSGLLALLRSKTGLAWSLHTLTTASFALGILLMIAAAGATFNFNRQMLETTSWLSHRQEVLKKIEEVKTDLADLASGERVYIITGEQRLLKEREPTKTKTKEDFQTVLT